MLTRCACKCAPSTLSETAFSVCTCTSFHWHYLDRSKWQQQRQYNKTRASGWLRRQRTSNCQAELSNWFTCKSRWALSIVFVNLLTNGNKRRPVLFVKTTRMMMMMELQRETSKVHSHSHTTRWQLRWCHFLLSSSLVNLCALVTLCKTLF